jgi:hypothetical protein
MGTQRSPEDRFDEALRAWADRPPRLDSRAAARAVTSRLGERRRQPPRLVWTLATAAAVAVAAAGVLVVRVTSPPLGPQQAGMVLATPTLTEGQILIWLDEETPLYMTYAAPDTGAQ